VPPIGRSRQPDIRLAEPAVDTLPEKQAKPIGGWAGIYHLPEDHRRINRLRLAYVLLQ
jgi:hypothetical protein